MRFTIFLSAWGLVFGMSLVYIVVGGINDASVSLVARRRTQAVEKISILLFESEDQAAAIFEDVADLPRRTLLPLIQTLAVDLDGQARRRLQNLVAASGLQRFVRRRARSRRWRLRVQAAQLNYLVVHPDFDRKLLLKDPHPLVRARAVEALTDDQAAEVVPELVQLLGDESLAVRIAAQHGLVTAGAASVPELLRQLALGGPSSLAALEVAANITDSRLTAALDRYTRDGDPLARMMACRALGNGVGDEGIPMLHRLIDDHDPDVKASAIEALGHLGSQASVALIGSKLGDRSFLVRRASGLALDSLGASGHLVLRRHLRDPDRYARDMARQMLDAAAARRGLDLVPPIQSLDIQSLDIQPQRPVTAPTWVEGSGGAVATEVRVAELAAPPPSTPPLNDAAAMFAAMLAMEKQRNSGQDFTLEELVAPAEIEDEL